MTHVPTPKPRLLVDRYQLQERLNPTPSEGSRQTWLAEDVVDRKPVVVKLVPLKSGLNWADFKLFEREATILRLLDHPRIPKYLDFLELDTPDYQGSVLVQEYIDARSIQTQVESGQLFTPEMVKEIAIQILEILTYLHRLNPPVIHRDIKPSNLLIGDRSGNSIGQVYLVDFGAVQTIASTEYDTFTVVGSYGYMPFEQFGGQCVSASDLYSLGATLIYCLTGKHPADLPQINGKLEFSSFITIDWQFHQWLQQMIAPSVSQRFKTTEEALVKLRTIELKPESSLLLNDPDRCIITLDQMPDRLACKIIGYRFTQIIDIMTVSIVSLCFLSIYLYYYYSRQNPNLYYVAFVALTGFFTIKSIRSMDIFYKNLVAHLTIDRERLTFQFKILKLFRVKSFKIKNTHNIVKIEQVLDASSNTTALIFWNGIKKHSIMLSPAEARYLGEALSSWLSVPFEQRQVRYLSPNQKSRLP